MSGKVLQLFVHLCDDEEEMAMLFDSTSAGVFKKTQDPLFLKSLHSWAPAGFFGRWWMLRATFEA